MARLMIIGEPDTCYVKFPLPTADKRAHLSASGYSTVLASLRTSNIPFNSAF
ncbi:hypothetical protein POSPLADRAFT_1038350 [Postia placenta MAD-698-R-SB12]|uniref:Uncharacterized protein n=1 Tax=Postia placenta MAD-698-R-SB12 TaxID=670580 RepID=A0A1X6NAN3_9APHY|nr:hypothetical protein POSPLADRAFT_1038350 [Postia placenta MAD-698-R-SB12]OSX65708.1 hypothetical protein POSPLADRAFT_1038350 [Postia placenta MAD-698-R-SB12]